MADIIFFAVVAAFIAWRLRSVLGKKVEIEKKTFDDIKTVKPISVRSSESADPVRLVQDIRQEIIPPVENLSKYSKPIVDKVSDVKKIDQGFTVEGFLKGANAAFEMILQGLSKGDSKTLTRLLKPEVLNLFNDIINERKIKGLVDETTLIAIKNTEITGIDLRNTVAVIKVRFVTEQVKVTKDSEGKIVEGDVSLVEEIEDIWTFEKDLRSNNPNWYLSEVE